MDSQEVKRVSDVMSALHYFNSVGYWAEAVGRGIVWDRGEINRFAILYVLLLSPPDSDHSGFGVVRWR